jgi:hypothetical protein
VPTYKSKDKTVQVSGSGPKGEAVGPISFESGSYTTKDDNEVLVLDALALLDSSPVAFDQKEE